MSVLYLFAANKFMNEDNAVGVIVGAIVIFFVTRELWCWFIKTNAVLEKLNEIEERLKQNG